VFYLHSRLLERSARVNEEYVEKITNGRVKGKTGSLTGLPIIENPGRRRHGLRADERDFHHRRPDLLETDLFNAGMRPAINAGISVSRVGGAAQTNIIKKLGGGVRLALAQLPRTRAFSQFASDLDEATRRQLERGQRVTELMKQKQYAPSPSRKWHCPCTPPTTASSTRSTRRKVVETEAALQSFARSSYADLLKASTPNPILSGEVEAGAQEVLPPNSSRRCKRTVKSRQWQAQKEIAGKIASIKNTQKITKAIGNGGGKQDAQGAGPDAGGRAPTRKRSARSSVHLRQVNLGLQASPHLERRFSPSASS